MSAESSPPRRILHVDMDAFYASVEERDHPELAGRPVVVGGTPQGRGVVAAANYAARKYGIHSAMPAVTARRRCPQAVFLPCRIDHYAKVARKIREIFQRYTPLVEPLSLDEAFLDVSGSERLFGPAERIGRRIQQNILAELRLVASVGVAPNKFLAKIASDLKKPAGFVVVHPDRIHQFLDPLPIQRIWGIGRQGSKFFSGLGVSRIGQLRQLPLQLLRDHLGNHGEHFRRLASGIDERQVVPDREAKSVSHETTFAADVRDPQALRAWLLELTDQVARRLRRHKLRGRRLQIKVRFADFQTITRSESLREPTNITDELWQVASKLLDTRLADEHLPVRLLGIGVSGIDRSEIQQGTLFDNEQRKKQSQLDKVLDDVDDALGRHVLRRGSGLNRSSP